MSQNEPIFIRPAATPWYLVPCAWTLNAVCCPLWLLNGFMPARYMTTWWHALVLVYLSVYLTHTWRAAHLTTLTWILSLYIPPASTIVMVYAHRLRRELIDKLSWTGFLFQQLLTHLAPSLMVWIFLPMAHTTPLSSSACFVLWTTVYFSYLRFAVGETPLRNYFVDDAQAPVVMLWWALFFLASCLVIEIWSAWI